ncbi:hypothetical protein DFH06DRAFT_1468769 [Mycena polygramma]|nr:hypothetical protein DFH06DRAFT_1468769 [Mycena polygramma]
MTENPSHSTDNSTGLRTTVCLVCTTFKSSTMLPDPIRATELRQIVRSNVMPPVSVDAGLRDVIDQASAELARYDEEIGRINSILSGIVSGRAALEAHVRECQSVFSPARRLPMELLAEIFEMCLPVYHNHRAQSPATSGAELKRLAGYEVLQLSQVCSRWRQVALCTSRLWSTIAVDTECWSSPLSVARGLSLLASSLERSREHPLKLHISLSGDDPNAEAVMELLCRHAERWRHLSLCASGASGQHLTAVKGRLHLLKLAYLATPHKGLEALELAPALTKVVFTGRPDDVPKLPWSQILNFTFLVYPEHPSTVSAALAVAQMLGADTVFRFNADLSDTDGDVQWAPVSSDVKSLHLELTLSDSSARAKQVLGQIFAALTLPHLQRLRLTPRDGTLAVWNPQQFSAFALRSSLHTHLTSLFIRVIITDTELLQALACLPVLKEFAFTERNSLLDTSITDKLLQGLSWDPDGGSSLVPELRYLSLWFLPTCSAEAYVDLLASRSRLRVSTGSPPFHAKLRSVGAVEQKFSPVTYARITDLVSLGELRFTFTGNDL